MSKNESPLTPTQCKMARAGLGLGIRELAAAAKCAPATVVRFEAGESLHHRSVQAIHETLVEAGAVFFMTENGQEAVSIKAD